MGSRKTSKREEIMRKYLSILAVLAVAACGTSQGVQVANQSDQVVRATSAPAEKKVAEKSDAMIENVQSGAPAVVEAAADKVTAVPQSNCFAPSHTMLAQLACVKAIAEKDSALANNEVVKNVIRSGEDLADGITKGIYTDAKAKVAFMQELYVLQSQGITSFGGL
jgi:predicted metal-binding protein